MGKFQDKPHNRHQMEKMDYPKAYLYRRIVLAKLFIDRDYHTEINLDDIADEALFSRFHFIRLFRKIVGKTPHQYLIDVRIEQAKQLLREGATVSATCFAVGFDSVSSFSGLFKRRTGLSPSVFQQEYKLNIERVTAKPLKYIPGCFAEKNGWIEKSNFEEARKK